MKLLESRKQVEVLDCTLRDGSYVIDFKFTLAHTREISQELAASGIRLIEVAHGVGLNGSQKSGKALATDSEYIREAKNAVGSQAEIGCFFIPGVGDNTHIKEARESGLDFIRIGTDCFDYQKAFESIKYAKSLGLRTYSNLMKSYLMTPYDLARAGRAIESSGADGVSVVDSAGGMMPEEVFVYVDALVKTVDIPVGFHGHNNLGLANACGKSAVEAGARIIDTTLQGMGRSAGNVQTESFVLILQRMGIDCGADAVRLLELGRKTVRPLLGAAGVQPEDLASGFSLFHSGFLTWVNEAAEKFGVNPVTIILETSKNSAQNPTRENIFSLAANISSQRIVQLTQVPKSKAAS